MNRPEHSEALKKQLSKRLIQAIDSDDIDSLKVLIAAGADPEHWTGYGDKNLCAYGKLCTAIATGPLTTQKELDKIEHGYEMLELMLRGSHVPLPYQIVQILTAGRSVSSPALVKKAGKKRDRVCEISEAIHAYHRIKNFAHNKRELAPELVKNAKLIWPEFEKYGQRFSLPDILENGDISDPLRMQVFGIQKSLRALRDWNPELYAELMHDDKVWATREDAQRWAAFIDHSRPVETWVVNPPAWKARALENGHKEMALERYLRNECDSPGVKR